MTHQSNFVVVIKSGGKILREHGGEVRLPFGSEYGVLLKNLNSRKAVVRVGIDGEDTCGGKELVIDPGQSLELEGFMEGSIVRNRFRFIQKTKEIAEHRGDRVDDGIVRVEYRFEKAVVNVKEITEHHHHDHYHNGWHWYPYWSYHPWSPPHPIIKYGVSSHTTCNTFDPNMTYADKGDTSMIPCSAHFAAGDGIAQVSSEPQTCLNQVGDISPEEGITVKGSETRQEFHSVVVDELEESSHVITLRLVGCEPSTRVEVKTPVTTRTKVKCPTCGRSSKSNVKYCGECGTRLPLT